jgi:hypothetical protein
MEYCDDACLFMFSEGQVNRLRAYVLTNLQNILSNRTACDTAGVSSTQEITALETQLKISPNPSNNIFNVIYKPAIRTGNIVILDSKGTIVYIAENISEIALQNGYQLNLTSFKNGVYEVVLTIDKLAVAKRLIKL